MKKDKPIKPIQETKPPHEKPLSLDMSFEEAMKRIVRVEPPPKEE